MDAASVAWCAAVLLALVLLTVAGAVAVGKARRAARRRALVKLLREKDGDAPPRPPPAPRDWSVQPLPREGVRRVVIVGGSFAGLAAARELEELAGASVEVVVVERKEYFEYTPGALRLMVEPQKCRQLQAPIRDIIAEGGAATDSRTRLVRGEVLSVADGAVKVAALAPPRTLETLRGFETRSAERTTTFDLPFDTLLLATGSSYAWPIKPSPQSYGLAGRRIAVELANDQLRRASSVLVVGAGPVGVELAAEIIEEFPDVSLTLVSNKDRLLPALPDAMGAAALAWFRARGVTVILEDSVPVRRFGMSRRSSADMSDLDDALASSDEEGEVSDDVAAPPARVRRRRKAGQRPRQASDVDDSDDANGVEPGAAGGGLGPATGELPQRHIRTAGGVDIHAQVVYTCVGQVATVEYVVASESLRGCMTSGGLLRVGDDLRVEGHENIFAVGDVIAHKSMEQKLAHTAELTGLAAAENVVRLMEGRPTLPYPEGFAHSDKTPRIVVITLGRREAVLRFNNIVLVGWLGRRVAAAAKVFIEWSKMLQARRHWFGLWVWKLGDDLALWANRTIVRPPVGNEPMR